MIYRYVATIFKAAMGDRKIATSPCARIKHERPAKRKVTPVSTEVVEAIAAGVPGRYRALVILAAGTGMRQGEVFGVTVDRIDFLRRQILVDRQLTTVTGRAPAFGPTKNGVERTIPLPQVVVDALALHIQRFPLGEDGLVFRNGHDAPLRRSNFNDTWRRVCRETGAGDLTFHGLRHYYASLLIRHGESVKTVQERLGHKSAVETLDTYAHLWSDSDDRTREAVDAVLGAGALADSVRTDGVSRIV